MKRTPLTRKTPLRRKSPPKRKKTDGGLKRSPLSSRSAKGKVADTVYRALKRLVAPFVKKCLRCECLGLGWKSDDNPGGLDAHHLGRRVGFWLFVFVPVCRTCHDEIHANEKQAREDGWILKPRKKQ